MKQYQFVTTWFLEATPEAVFDALLHSESWPDWWRGVTRVEELERGDADGLGNVRRYTFRSLLPYSLTFQMRSTMIDRPSVLAGDASGDLVGRGRWSLTPAEGGVTVRYDWQVATTREWMNVLAPITGPIFAWNHDLVMRWGEEGLRGHLGLPSRVEDDDRARTRRRRLAIAGGLAVAAFATLRSWRRRKAGA